MARPIPYEAIPNGWFAVASSDEVPRGKVVERRYFDRELVVYRGDDGVAQVRDAYCPHLGAHLGDGKVVGNRLRCPFHGFEFDGSGACVATPYGTRPPARAKLGTYLVKEQDGLVFLWFHAEGAAPHYDLPVIPGEGFSRYRMETLNFRGHPQEVSENSSDIGHFAPVHAYAEAQMIGEAKVEGAVLRAHYRVARKLDFIGLPFAAALEFKADVHGLGFSFVHAQVKAIGVDVHLLVLPTPIDASHIDLRVAARVRSPVPDALSELALAIVFRAFLGDLRLDVPLWSRKRYIERPALAEGDGPIATYRRYAQQFYCKDAGKVSLPVVEDTREAAE